MTTDLIVAEEHSQLYDLWIKQGDRNLSVCHIDFHCDMRGLLIDRQQGKARQVWQFDPFMNRLDSGSFLTYAVMQGIVTSLRWVHDEFGGRKYDDLYCVKYETDLTALPFRLIGRQKWVPFTFVEQTFNDWNGPRQGEYLSIDWDGIAYVDYDINHIRGLMAEILNREFKTEAIFVCRSPEYCHSSRELFDEFISGLENKFNTDAVILPPKEHQPVHYSAPWKLYHSLEHSLLRLMRRFNIY